MHKDYHSCSVSEIIEAIDAMSPSSFYTCCLAVSEWQGETSEFSIDCQSEIEELAESMPDGEFDEDAAYEKYWADYDVFSDALRQTVLEDYGITEEQFSLLEAAGNFEDSNPGCIWPFLKKDKNLSLVSRL
ncbi:MAG TPA: hypothetical protein PLW81_00415 [Thiobacillaceae bacterium]|nr:hypothetical protein [Thiobacillaceae bacterium]